ncbi:MAG: DUF2267 domain-containing protein [Chloroflexi bacterium]|nr:DUF2267 domain-containing protein [Chloroflexota bacterium]
MDEIVKKLVKQLGISDDIARKAVELIVGQLKGKLPEPIASQLDGILSGEVDAASLGGGEGLLEKGKDLLGGLFGGKKS